MALDTSGLYTVWPIGAEVRSDGKDIAQAGRAYLELITDTQGTWNGMRSCFRAPADQVDTAVAAYDDLVVHGVIIGNATKDIETALMAYGNAIDDLQPARRAAQQAAREFAADVRNGVDVPTSGPGSEWAIQQQIDDVVSRLQTAMNDCSTALEAIEANLDTDQLFSGPVPAAIQFAVSTGLKSLSFTSIEYTASTTVETVTDRNLLNRLRNTQVSFDDSGGFPWIRADMPAGRTATTVSGPSSSFTQTTNSFMLAGPVQWMMKLPGPVGNRYRTAFNPDFSNRVGTTVTTQTQRSPWFSQDPSRTRITTTTDADWTETRLDGTLGTVGRVARNAGVVGDIAGIGLTWHDEGAQARQEVYQGQQYQHLSTEEKQQEISQRRFVSTATNTGIDLGVAGGAALAGAAIGGPIGAGVGFVGGLAVSAFMDVEIGGKTTKDRVSDAANDVVDWGQKKWNDWFG